MQVGSARKKERASIANTNLKDEKLTKVREEKVDIEKRLCVAEERVRNFRTVADAHGLSLMSMHRVYSTLPRPASTLSRPAYKEPTYQNIEEATCSVSIESSQPAHSVAGKKDVKEESKFSRSCSKVSGSEHKDDAK